MFHPDVNATDNGAHLLCDLTAATREIAELRARIAKLEKHVDSILALHYASGFAPETIVATETMLAVEPEVEQNSDTSGGQTVDSTELSDDEIYDEIQDDLHAAFMEEFERAPCCPAGSDEIDNEACPDNADGHTDFEIYNHEPLIETALHDDVESNLEEIPEKSEVSCLPAAHLSLICNATTKPVCEPDKLTLIKGIDEAISEQLAGLGFTRFHDIATLTPDQVGALKCALTDGTAIQRNCWTEQAAILATGKPTFYAQTLLSGTSEAAKSVKTVIQRAPVLKDLPAQSHLDRSFAQLLLPPQECKAKTPSIETANAAERVLNMVAARNLPRSIYIDYPTPEFCKDNAARMASFIPSDLSELAETGMKIAHVAPQRDRDYGNLKAMAVSLLATLAIAGATFLASGFELNVAFAKSLPQEACQLGGYLNLPDPCKPFFGRVL